MGAFGSESILSKMQVQDLGESYNVPRTSCLKSKLYSGRPKKEVVKRSANAQDHVPSG